MIELLARRLVKNWEHPTDPAAREGYGILCGAVGIGFNLLLAALKLLAGSLSGSIAATADALNNLSDAGSSVVTLVSFRMAAKKADADHPFGHGRIEYLAGLAVAVAVLITGIELGRSSVLKILHPVPTAFSLVSIAILTVSILIKLYMAHYNHRIGRLINSSAMRATMLDSLSDSGATSAVLLSMLLEKYFHWTVDGWCGALVAGLVIWAGFKAIHETIGPLLGQPPDKELVESIERTVLGFSPIVGVHDLMVHDYGPGRRMVSLHAEVPCDGDLLAMHDAIDLAETEVSRRYFCAAVIHMDPIETHNEHVVALRTRMEELAQTLDGRISIHDFRVVTGPTHTNLIFDLVLPFDLKFSDEQAVAELRRKAEDWDGNYHLVVTVDKASI